MAGRSSAEDEPLVRPFFLTRGRTAGELPLDAVVITRSHLGAGVSDIDVALEVEHERILLLCGRPLAVAEVAGHLRLPLGVVRVLLDDLRRSGLLDVVRERPEVDEALIDRLIRGVERL